jgi:hypothetical protein
MSDRPPLRRSLRQGIAAAGLGLALVLTAWLAGCTETVMVSHPAPVEPAPRPVPEVQAPPARVPPDADRLTSLVVRAVPMGQMLQASLDKDPNWPVGKKVSRIKAEQLQCLRQRLSPEGYQQSRREAVDKFIERDPNQVQEAIEVLEQGGADVMASAFRAGLKNKNTGGDVEFDNIARNFTPQQMHSYSELTSRDKYEPLRKLLIGISNFPLGKNRGALVGKRIGLLVMRDALEHCQVPLSAIQ